MQSAQKLAKRFVFGRFFTGALMTVYVKWSLLTTQGALSLKDTNALEKQIKSREMSMFMHRFGARKPQFSKFGYRPVV